MSPIAPSGTLRRITMAKNDWDKMSDADFISEARLFLPVLTKFFERAEVHQETLTEPKKPRCPFCIGGIQSISGKRCPKCNPATVQPESKEPEKP